MSLGKIDSFLVSRQRLCLHQPKCVCFLLLSTFFFTKLKQKKGIAQCKIIIHFEGHIFFSQTLKETVGYGVAYLHEGLSEAETKIVEQLFNSGAIQASDTVSQEIDVILEPDSKSCHDEACSIARYCP